jgi:hypothetical protein
MIFGAAAGSGVGRIHLFGEIRPKESVVLDIEPQHWRPRRPPEFGSRFDQQSISQKRSASGHEVL